MTPTIQRKDRINLFRAMRERLLLCADSSRARIRENERKLSLEQEFLTRIQGELEKVEAIISREESRS